LLLFVVALALWCVPVFTSPVRILVSLFLVFWSVPGLFSSFIIVCLVVLLLSFCLLFAFYLRALCLLFPCFLLSLFLLPACLFSLFLLSYYLD